MFYGHSNEKDEIFLWWLIDLKAFRAALIRRNSLIKVSRQKLNKDGTTGFMSFDVRGLPRNVIIGASDSELAALTERFKEAA